MDLKDHKTDKTKSAAGVWLTYDGAQFKLAATGTPEYTRAMAKAARKHPTHKVRKDAALAANIAREALADAVVLDWKGVTDQGKEVPCTRENKLALLDIEAFREWVSTEAQDVANFQAEALAEDAAAVKSGSPVVGEVGATSGTPASAS